jgi:hypothetical protein
MNEVIESQRMTSKWKLVMIFGKNSGREKPLRYGGCKRILLTFA